MVIGVVGGVVYLASSKLLLKIQIDDVVNAIPVHFFCGIWGVISVSLFATKDNYSLAYYGDGDKCKGLFYGGHGNALGANLVFILAVIAWVGTTSFVLFYGIKKTIGDEDIGMDDSKHGGRQIQYPVVV